MKLPRPHILIVDDDPGIRDVLFRGFRDSGLPVTTFADGASLLAAVHQTDVHSILLDVNMPNLSGVETLKQLRRGGCEAPVFMISGVGDIPLAVEAIRNGASDFFQKPFRIYDIVAQVLQTVEALSDSRPTDTSSLQKFPGRDLLTPREMEVLAKVVSGKSTKEVGRTLGVSPRTVEVHRSNILQKLGVRNAIDLTRLVLGAA